MRPTMFSSGVNSFLSSNVPCIISRSARWRESSASAFLRSASACLAASSRSACSPGDTYLSTVARREGVIQLPQIRVVLRRSGSVWICSHHAGDASDPTHFSPRHLAPVMLAL